MNIIFTKRALVALFALLIVAGGVYLYVLSKQANVVSPSITEGWQTYTDSQYNFSFSYPSDFALTTQQSPPWNSSCGSDDDIYSSHLCLYYVGNQTSDGFVAANLEVRISSPSTTKAECEKAWPSPNGHDSPLQQKIINGITFLYDLTGGAATGHYLSTDQYRVYRSDTCYTIALNLNSDRGVSEKGLSKEFSDVMRAKLRSIFSTFEFSK